MVDKNQRSFITASMYSTVICSVTCLAMSESHDEFMEGRPASTLLGFHKSSNMRSISFLIHTLVGSQPPPRHEEFLANDSFLPE